MDKRIEGLFVPLDEVDKGLDSAAGVFLRYCMSDVRLTEACKRLTLFNLLNGADHVVDKVLQIAKRIGNTRRFVYLC